MMGRSESFVKSESSSSSTVKPKKTTLSKTDLRGKKYCYCTGGASFFPLFSFF